MSDPDPDPDPDSDSDSDRAIDVVVRLPDRLRGALKDPFGPLYTDPEALLADTDPEKPLIAVGDIVTHHLECAGARIDLALVDGHTEREPVEGAVRSVVERDQDKTVRNPPATLTAELLRALRDALTAESPVSVLVEGEEDLATLPAIAVAPDGASVVYGQPGEGMVRVPVTAETRERIRELLSRMDGDPERVCAVLGIDD